MDGIEFLQHILYRLLHFVQSPLSRHITLYLIEPLVYVLLGLGEAVVNHYGQAIEGGWFVVLLCHMCPQ